MSRATNRLAIYVILYVVAAAAVLGVFAYRAKQKNKIIAFNGSAQQAVSQNGETSEVPTTDAATQSSTDTASQEASNTSESNAPLEEAPIMISENPLKGRTIFVSKGCVKCHSVWGVGGTLGPDLSRAGMGRSYSQISGLLWSHSPRMVELMEQRGVSRPSFTPDEMSELVSYLYYLNYFNEPGNAVAGRTLFSEKACVLCHSVGGIGGNVATGLDKYQEYASPLFMVQGMWNFGPGMSASLRSHGITQPPLRGKDIADIAAYLRGQAFRTSSEPKLMSPGNPINGQRLFTDKGCVRCHSIFSNGGKVGPDLARKDLFESATEIAGAMWNHGPQMWLKMQQTGIAKPSFSANELADVISYLYFVRYVDEAGNTENGRRLFEQRACSECHTIGQGEKIGPDLGTSKAARSSVSLTAAMWNHAPIMEKLTEAKRLPWPKFESDEMRDLVEFIKFASGQPPKSTAK